MLNEGLMAVNNIAKDNINDAHKILWRPAKEILVGDLSDLNLERCPEQPDMPHWYTFHVLPDRQKCKITPVCKIIKNALTALNKNGLSPHMIALDGQFWKLILEY